MRIKLRVLKKIISVASSALLLINSFSPFLLIAPSFINQVKAEEPTITQTQDPTPTDIISPAPTAEPTLVPTETPTPTPTVEVIPTETPTPTIEVTPTSEPIVTPEPTPIQTPSQWTFENVELNKEYIAPQNSELKLTFTKLPDPSGNIKIEEITLTEEQIKQTGSLSDKAYDITSDMKDGDFTYNLSLPIPESSKGKAVEVKFAEEISSIGSAAKVENTLTKTDTSVSVTSLDHFTIFVVSGLTTPITTTLVDNLQPSWDAVGGGGVYSSYAGYPGYAYVSPGTTAVYAGSEAGIIKAGLTPGLDGHYWDDGIFGFKPTATINDFSTMPLTYDVQNQYGENPVWMTIEIDTGVLGDRNDDAVYQFVPTAYPAGWNTVNAGAGLWQKWTSHTSGTATGPLMSLSAVASANTGLSVMRTYLRLGMGDSYHGIAGLGTVAWVDKVTLGGITYDFVVNRATTSCTGASIAPPAGTTACYSTIQAAVNAATSGETINIAAGTYLENINVDKSLTIQGVGDATIINGAIVSGGSTVVIQDLKIITPGAVNYDEYYYGVRATANHTLTLNNVTIDVSGTDIDYYGIRMGFEENSTSAVININNSRIKGYAAIYLNGSPEGGSIVQTGTHINVTDSTLTGTTQFSGNTSDFAVIAIDNTTGVNIDFAGASSVVNEYTNSAQAKQRLIRFRNASGTTVTGSPTYTNGPGSTVNASALFMSYGSDTNTVNGQDVARWITNATEFESALASSATTPIVVERYGALIVTTGNNTLKTGVTLIVEDHAQVTIDAGDTFINTGTIVIETGATFINNGTLQSASITGTAEYGQLLTATITGLTNAGTPSYQWKRGGVDIVGATASTYTLASADIGTIITVTATTTGISGTGFITSVGTGVVTALKAITAFSFASPASTGVITGTNIAVTVPYGTTLTALVPTITVSAGASVSPLSGIANNFSSPVHYIVTAADASTADYTVTVQKAPLLTLDKIVVNDNGGSAVESAWTLTATGTGATGSAGVVTRFVTTPTIGWQSFDSTVHTCDGVPYSSFASSTFDYWGVDNTDLPDRSSVTSIDYCVRGTGNVNASYNQIGGYFTGQSGGESCFNVPISSISATDNHDIWYSDNSYSFTGGSTDAGSTIDCMYVKIHTSTSVLTLSGPGAAGSTDVVSGPTFKADTYTLGESGGPTGYTASSWSCVKNSASAVDGSSITLGLGDSATCTITNNDLDIFPPTVTNVTSTHANGTFTAGEMIPITVTFNEIVNVIANPTLYLRIGPFAGAQVLYAGGTGTNTLTFNYTVTGNAISADLDYLSTEAMTYDGGAVSDVVGNNATLTLPAPGAAGSLGANKNIVITDTTPPVIYLNGGTPVNVEYGSTYTDAGAYADDGIRGFPAVTPSGSVNTSVIGSYIITYNATDLSGNPAVPVIRTVNVVDTTAPVITLNGVTPNIEFGGSYTELGATTDDGSIVNITGSVNTAVVGSYTIYYNAFDAVDNAAIEVTRTVNVVPKAITVTADNQSKVVGSTDPALTYTHSALAGSDLDTIIIGSLGRDAGEGVGSYAINQGTVNAGENYDITFVPGTLTIVVTPPSGGGTVAGASTSNPSAPVCNDTKPGNAPVLLSAVAGFNSVTLTWAKASDPVSYYLMTFGTSSGAQTYGNPNIGDKDTTSYTVNGLSGRTTYYFKVRAGNGCMPGDFSNELSSAPSGGFVEGVPAGFEAGVLGEATKSAELTEELTGEPTPTTAIINAGLVKGIESIAKNNFSKYILPIVLIILLGALTFYFYKKRKNSSS